jgi:hypothetical protein
LFINHLLNSAHMRQKGVCDNAKLCLRHGSPTGNSSIGRVL